MAQQTAAQTPMLFLKLLGTPEIWLGDKAVKLETAKARALLFYLAVTQQPHSREVLVALLWGEMGEAQARRNLTATLTALRKELAPFVVVEPERIAFDTSAPYQSDVALFRHYVGEASSQSDAAALREATTLYQGDFLAGLTVKDAPLFEEWLAAEREQLREQMIQSLHRLVEQAIAAGDYAGGLDDAQRLLAMEPWHEAAHRQIMILHAQHGRREAALAQYETCRRLLLEEVGVEPMEETRALYERLQRGDVRPPHNLPPEPNPFVGRRDELAQIASLLGGEKCRLLTLVGPGGIGKTRLAIEAARRFTDSAAIHLADFRDGVYLVLLAGLAAEGAREVPSSDRSLITAIGEAVGMSFHGKSDIMGQLQSYLKDRALLLVCDNFEHLLTGMRYEPHLEALTAILRAAPKVKVLVTSRERLNLQEEWVLEVGGLAYPSHVEEVGGPGLEPGAEDALAYDAVALFVQRAQQAQAGFVLSNEDHPDPDHSMGDVPAVIRLCHLLEGMPLGLELAASWLRDLSCAEIVTEIETGLDLLTARLHNVPERHQSLAAVFEGSWQRLDAQEQAALCALSIFRGSFGREAAATITGARRPMLARLADKSLLRRSPGGRYEMHSMLRQFLTEKMATVEGMVDPVALREAYAQYYLRFVAEREETLRSAADLKTLDELWQELDEICQAWHWAISLGDGTLLAESLGGLSRFYDITGLFQEGEDHFAAAAAHFRTLQGAAARAGESRAGEEPAETGRKLLVRLWIEQARHLCRRGQARRAMEILPNAAAEASTLQPEDLMAMVELQWAEATSIANDHPALHDHAHKALDVARRVGRQEIEAEALRYCGIAEERMQRLEQAGEFYRQSLAVFRQVGDRRGASLALNNLALIHFFQHDFATSQPAFEEALAGFEAIGDRWGQNVVLNNLGNQYFINHNYEAARATYRQGLALARALNDLAGEAHLQHNLGAIACFLGLFEEAQEHLQKGLRNRREIGARLYEGFSLVVLGVLHSYMGDFTAAIDYFEQVEQVAREQAAPLLEVSALAQKGHALVMLEEMRAAHDAYSRVLNITEELGKPEAALEAMAGLAEVKLLLGEREEALRLVETLLPQLDSEDVQTEIDPFQIHLSCYRVLHALHDGRSRAVLETAQRQLMGRALQLQDPTLRQSYLERIPTHRALMQLVGELQGMER